MKIAQVVTLVSPDGAYGGPLRVAMNQLAALKASGHDVTLFATHRGYGRPPTQVDGMPLVSYPARTVIPKVGFAGLASPALMARLRRDLAGFDVVHVHLARDLVTLPAAWLTLRMGIPLVVQTHGMIDRSSNPLAVPLDAVLTRPVLSGASTVFYLTDKEKEDLTEVTRGGAHLSHLINGVPRSDVVERPRSPMEVLFLARLHPRKRATHFVQAALLLTSEFPGVFFTLVGPDEGDGTAVRHLLQQAGWPTRIRWEGALPPEETLQRMAQASLFVLPSVDEPFPMSVLEAASVGLPVIVTNTCGLAEAVAQWGAGGVIDDSVGDLAITIRRFLQDPDETRRCGHLAAAMVQEQFGMPAVLDRLMVAYHPAGARKAS
jgi:glycosyltransferase involved in cell wall biosynthesis